MKARRLFNAVMVSLCMVHGVGMPGPVSATETEIWTIDTFEEFADGDLEDLSLTAEGELILAPQSDTMMTMKGQNLTVWALAGDSQGNVYAGTGDQGQVLQMTPDGETSVYFDSPEIGILSLAVDAQDNVFAGSAPDGLIYKLTPDGSQTVWASTGEHYVWSLVFDESGVLYAGTGEQGKIFKIMPDGTTSVLYDSPQSHVMTLAHDAGGWLYAGTEGKGITYKIGLDGTVFSLYDAKEQEIRALTLDSLGNLYIAAISSEFFPQTQNQGQLEHVETPSAEQTTKTSTIYRITPAGAVTTIATLPNELVYAMLMDENDTLLVGTDTQGHLCRIIPATRSVQQVLSVDAGKISALWHTAAGEVYAGTSDSGSIVRIGAESVEQGSYLSPVHDTTVRATWGKIFWRGSSNQVGVQTRSGNTAVPDDTWSPWSEELLNQEGASIPNPAARFIQWKAVLHRSADNPESPRVEEVSLAYLPHNLAPEVQDIAAFYPGREQSAPQETGNGSSSQSNGNGRASDIEVTPPKQIPPGHVAIGWEASDPNQDTLEYTISLRGEHEARWRVLEEEFDSTGYFLDTNTLPDGGYYVKVTASDIPSNPPDRALISERISTRFDIDNTSPEVLIALNQRQDNAADVLITVLAQDDASRLTTAEYALDGEEWIPIFPDDAVTDSREEKYSIPLKHLRDEEEHLVVFRVTDTHQNIGVAKFVFSLQDLTPVVPQEEPEAEPQTP